MGFVDYIRSQKERSKTNVLQTSFLQQGFHKTLGWYFVCELERL